MTCAIQRQNAVLWLHKTQSKRKKFTKNTRKIRQREKRKPKPQLHKACRFGSHKWTKRKNQIERTMWAMHSKNAQVCWFYWHCCSFQVSYVHLLHCAVLHCLSYRRKNIFNKKTLTNFHPRMCKSKGYIRCTNISSTFLKIAFSTVRFYSHWLKCLHRCAFVHRKANERIWMHRIHHRRRASVLLKMWFPNVIKRDPNQQPRSMMRIEEEEEEAVSLGFPPFEIFPFPVSALPYGVWFGGQRLAFMSNICHDHNVSNAATDTARSSNYTASLLVCMRMRMEGSS